MVSTSLHWSVKSISDTIQAEVKVTNIAAVGIRQQDISNGDVYKLNGCVAVTRFLESFYTTSKIVDYGLQFSGYGLCTAKAYTIESSTENSYMR